MESSKPQATSPKSGSEPKRTVALWSISTSSSFLTGTSFEPDIDRQKGPFLKAKNDGSQYHERTMWDISYTFTEISIQNVNE
jgi:hypothetical protein